MSKTASVQPGPVRLRPVGTRRMGPHVCRAKHGATAVQGTAKVGASVAAAGPVYIIFESRFAQDLFCAVPTSCVIPPFLLGTAWLFRGTLGKRGFRLPDFDTASARTAARRDGFYLFTSSAHKGSTQGSG
jgi:hypothetical protein